MSVLTPRTIVISVPKQGNEGVTSPTGTGIKRYFDLDFEEPSDGQPRKRRRLTHLTPEEKLLRRKLKNRVAAQTARDRKKARIDEIELMLAQLEEQNKQLLDENRALRQQTGVLTQENKELKERLGLPSEGIVNGEKSVLSESAVLVPLPKEQQLTLSPSMMHSVAFLMTYSLICLTSLTNLMKQAKVTPQLLHSLQQHHKGKENNPCINTVLDKWWGPQQRSWNPSKN